MSDYMDGSFTDPKAEMVSATIAPIPPTTSPTSSITPPPGWLPMHDGFVQIHADKGEDANSIAILMEAEFPGLRTDPMEWIQERIRLGRDGRVMNY